MLEKKVIVIAGGLGLLGKKFVEYLAEEKSIVIIADIAIKYGRDYANSLLSDNNEFKIEFHPLDITSDISINELIHDISERYGKIDAFVNTSYPRNKNWGNILENVSYDDFCENLNLHLGGYYLCMKKFAFFFKKQGYGNIISISSIYGVIAPKFEIYDDTSVNGKKMTMPVEYAPIKSGIIHLTKYFSKYFKNSNVRFNCISPGGILAGQPKDFIEKYNVHACNKGMLDPADILGGLKFLLSDDSKCVNGHNLIIDDGWTL